MHVGKQERRSIVRRLPQPCLRGVAHMLSERGASFVKTLSFIDEGLWGFEVADADGYVLAFFHLRGDEAPPQSQP